MGLMIASAQQQDELRLLSSSYSVLNAKTGNAMFYRPVYEHKGSTLSADSGYLHKDDIGRQYFEAYSNVIITQPTGTQIFADKLHYDAASQNATLTRNVRMVSRSSVLTTNHLEYNMRSSVGNYYGGGRITSGTDTITSTNATYFENTQDAFFNKKVVVRSQNVKIFTDSMKYNSPSSMTYFYTPTNIKGNKGENLYTEKGDYNTSTGIANFTKNNLYTEGSKMLKGDILHYNRSTGEGQAIKNVVFIDTLDKFYVYGDKGFYQESDESITMTDKPLVITVVKKDSTQNEPTVTAPSKKSSTSTKEVKKKEKTDKNVKTEIVAKESEESKDKTLKIESEALPKESTQMDSIFMTADTLFSKMILRSAYIAKNFHLSRDGGALDVEVEEDYGDDDSDSPETSFNEGTNGSSLQTDSLGKTVITKDSLQKKVKGKSSDTKQTVKKEVKKEITPQASNNKQPSRGEIKDLNRFELEKNSKADSILRKNAIVPKADFSTQIFNKALASAKNKEENANAPVDITKTRIVKAYHNVRMFKSDFQAVADSVYYGMADSMFRLMGKPMIWAEKSQISADTIYLQFVNQKLDNTLLVGNAFMVNSTLDSAKYNQLKGRKITGFFDKNRLERMFVDGNAENIIYVINEETNVATELFHDRSSRIKIYMENNKLKEYVSIRKVDGKVYPIAQLTQEKEFLPGFIWKPEDRPKSKEDLLNRKRDISQTKVKTPDPENKETDLKQGNSKGQEKKKITPILEENTAVEIQKDKTTVDSTSVKKEMKDKVIDTKAPTGIQKGTTKVDSTNLQQEAAKKEAPLKLQPSITKK
ncbi:hypothetical protein LZQ00_13105 [Sphingobacterium sp. SRCM116780]|uniref:OstA-like protein n=1 Tax=Sphingobacterium sp. SRCM116780 TaxID=2907623 RepID=UPI001F3F9486|nr:OstA-like protein [Sphingobacterium sp. SRCM116780]UIR55206.1 hypothetical protein LZQ00_13105 [Sphingobacterium sp. SRCM116780]